MSLVWLTAAVAMTVGGVRAARHRAHAAADLAALAAASHALDGPALACDVAESVARAAGGHVTGCVLRGRVADVTISASAHVPGFGTLPVTARARAGPAIVRPRKETSE
jgi:secretion/DNA translocation related TadE-like protein